MHGSLKQVVKKVFAGLGYDIRRRAPAAQAPWGTDPGWDSGYIKRFGNPGTVIDIGVADGTPQLYAAFPAAYHVLVDPLPAHEEAMQRILGKYRGEYHIAAVGAANGRLTINVELDSPARSSFLERTSVSESTSSIAQEEVELRTLDGLLAARQYAKPYLLKIDTEGYELEVIRGAATTLASTEYVIAEVSVVKRFEGSYRFAEFVAAMHDAGFCLHDVLRVVRKPTTGETMILDAVFRNTVGEQAG